MKIIGRVLIGGLSFVLATMAAQQARAQIGACCQEDGTCGQSDDVTCQAVVGATFQGEGVPCSPDPCSAACCQPNGACDILTPAACASGGGNYVGQYTSCTPLPCGGQPIGTAFTYQGFVENPAGTPVTNTCDFTFSLFDAPVAGTQIAGPEEVDDVAVTDGVFSIDRLDFGQRSLSGGTARWIALSIRCGTETDFTALSPRVRLTAVPHALTLPGLWTEYHPTSPNIIAGFRGNTVLPGAGGSTISGGGSLSRINVAADFAAVGGGSDNKATADHATVSGGEGNRALGDSAAVGGGLGNEAIAEASTVGGGSTNKASGIYSTVAGGHANEATLNSGAVGGGEGNEAVAPYATVPGGSANTAGGSYSLAAGRRAKVRDPIATGDSNGDEGTFIWADAAPSDFTSTGPNQFLIRAAGGVGINTSTPSRTLDIVGSMEVDTTTLVVDDATNRVGIGTASPSRTLDVVGSMEVDTTTLVVDDATNRVGIGTASPSRTLDVAGSMEVDTDTLVVVNGRVGIGTAVPNVPFHVRAGSDLNLSDSSGYAVLGDVNGANVVFDDNEIQARNNGAASDLVINAGGGLVTVGVPTSPPILATTAKLNVVEQDNVVAMFRRTGSDGTLVEFSRSNLFSEPIGSISVAGFTVSYNAFTGSHYAWTHEKIVRGTLVTLTGVNRSLHDHPESECIYGVLPSSIANDPKCLGAYLGLLEPTKPVTPENPHQVMAVGNGDMWVVDTGRAISPGDYLISSDVSGHAMLDDEARFPVGYVVARAGEPVDWSNVSETVDGRKHKRISVFFESFERGLSADSGKFVKLECEITNLKSEIAELKTLIESLHGKNGGAQ